MSTVTIDGINYDLTALEKDCWLRMLNGSLSSKHPFHDVAVANQGKHGVNLRTVVLRKVDTEQKRLTFHTDIRSGKWEELIVRPQVSFLFYNPSGRIQIRVSGSVSLHQEDSIADEAWAKTGMSSRRNYMAEQGPSSLLDTPGSGVPEQFESANPSPEASEAGRKNFGVVVTKVDWMEWLWLNAAGHRRATFRYNADNSFDANWLVP